MQRWLWCALVLFALPFLTSCDSRKTIVNGIDEKESNEILVFLSNKNIDAIKTPTVGGGGPGGSKEILFDIQVVEDSARDAMAYLNQAGLPRRRSQSLLKLFGTSGLVPSELQEKIKFQAGLAEQIASTIRKIDGVLDAEVQISFPEEDPLNPQAVKKEITASVYVKHSGVLDDPNTHLLTKIKRLVSSSISGLKFDFVTVIPDRARFSDTALVGFQGGFDEEKEFVTIWTVIVAKESVSRFRLIFLSSTLMILVLILGFVWTLWKTLPLLEQYGGFSALLHLKPIIAKEVEEEETEEGEEEEAEEKEAKEEIEEGVDET